MSAPYHGWPQSTSCMAGCPGRPHHSPRYRGCRSSRSVSSTRGSQTRAPPVAAKRCRTPWPGTVAPCMGSPPAPTRGTMHSSGGNCRWRRWRTHHQLGVVVAARCRQCESWPRSRASGAARREASFRLHPWATSRLSVNQSVRRGPCWSEGIAEAAQPSRCAASRRGTAAPRGGGRGARRHAGHRHVPWRWSLLSGTWALALRRGLGHGLGWPASLHGLANWPRLHAMAAVGGLLMETIC